MHVCLLYYSLDCVHSHDSDSAEVLVIKAAGADGCFPLPIFARERGGDGEAEPCCLVGCDWAPLSLFTHLFSSELTIKQ